MANVMQATGQWLIDQLKKLEAEAAKRRAEISIANGRIVAADAAAQKLSDATKRTDLRAQLHRMALRQATIVKAYRTFWGKVVDVTTKARGWLKANGFATQLGGLGVLQVPVSIVVLLTVGAVVWTANAWLIHANANQKRAVDELTKVLDAIAAGQITPEQGAAFLDKANAAADAGHPKTDPLGLANLAEAAMPLALIALGFLVLPRLLDAFAARPSTRRRAA